MIVEQAWVAVGDRENWERGLENGIWGIIPGLSHHWQRMKPGDLVLFYCKAPVKKFFGAGVVRSKFRQTVPLWKEELEEKRVIWPFRFEFDVAAMLPVDKWGSEGIPNTPFNLGLYGGLNPVPDFAKSSQILDLLRKTGTLKPDRPGVAKTAELIFEIGRIQRMVVENAYPIDNYVLDVIWKRTIRSVPTFAFSVGLRGKIEDSLHPLKQAYDMWNSRPFLVTEISNVDRVRDASSSLYPDFSSALKVLTTDELRKLHEAKKTYYSMEERFGLR